MSPRPAIDHIRKPQILRAAAEVITERGLAATRIADVAERAGTSPAAVIYWFETRERLLTEALAADEAAFGERLDERLDGIESARERLLVVLDSSAHATDLTLWIETWARSLHDPETWQMRERLDKEWRNRIAAIVAEGQASGEFAGGIDASAFATELSALMDGLSVKVTLGDPEVTGERMLAISTRFATLALGSDLSDSRAVEVVA